jgi:hypothetical protein
MLWTYIRAPGINNYSHYNRYNMKTERITTMALTKTAHRKIKVYKAKNDLNSQAQALEEILEKTEV